MSKLSTVSEKNLVLHYATYNAAYRNSKTIQLLLKLPKWKKSYTIIKKNLNNLRKIKNSKVQQLIIKKFIYFIRLCLLLQILPVLSRSSKTESLTAYDAEILIQLKNLWETLHLRDRAFNNFRMSLSANDRHRFSRIGGQLTDKNRRFRWSQGFSIENHHRRIMTEKKKPVLHRRPGNGKISTLR